MEIADGVVLKLDEMTTGEGTQGLRYEWEKIMIFERDYAEGLRTWMR